MNTRVIMDKSEYEDLVAKAKEADDTADFIRDVIDENRRLKLKVKTLERKLGDYEDKIAYACVRLFDNEYEEWKNGEDA